MKILFVDDMKSRRDEFLKNSIGHSVDFAKNASEAILFLEKNEYDVIYLDHDLEESHYQSNEDHHEDGRFIARKMSEMTQHYGKTVIVHSLNPDGRKEIRHILGRNFKSYSGPEYFKVTEIWKIEATIVFQALGLMPVC